MLLLPPGADAKVAGEPPFRFDRDTFDFANQTVWEYRDGVAQLRRKTAADAGKPDAYTRRCFVMARAAAQFHKFARFDPRSAPLDDATLARRVRAVARIQPWRAPFPPEKRIVFPGYADLRAFSKAHGRVLQENLGLGWPTYVRVGNWRMFTHHSREYQARTHAELEAALARGEFFVGYLSTFPRLSINHAVLFYAHRNGGAADRYWVYDPNHPEAPRRLDYLPAKEEFTFEKDWDFVGGFVRVYHVFGRAWQ